MTTAEPRLTGGGDGAQWDEAAAGQEVLDELCATLENARLSIEQKDLLMEMRSQVQTPDPLLTEGGKERAEAEAGVEAVAAELRTGRRPARVAACGWRRCENYTRR